MFMINLLNTFTQTRATDTCGDPCEAIPYVNYFFIDWTDSFLVNTGHFAHYATHSEDVTNMGVKAYMFTTQQPGTVPLFSFVRSGVDRMFLLALADGSAPPAPAGYVADNSVQTNNTAGYVYPSQICGSIPLYHLFSADIVDHLYTTDQVEKEALLSFNNYTDQGIIAYVLPPCTGELL
ncbi:hypothetical protein M422DRAFT_249532 [Sphaerobolus stellatus SS14]|uniref:DUF5648 domain-containing protein n=1 Tax=Sphaerobolus stellatus (strain SS14) TaxID=990650 RepID=A0A0C9W3U3_SPHS4|nr:hypothetical protein M422DRAFT_249532 [Sphaerobolus stellatus SS14]